jgi:hypothetical protein
MPIPWRLINGIEPVVCLRKLSDEKWLPKTTFKTYFISNNPVHHKFHNILLSILHPKGQLFQQKKTKLQRDKVIEAFGDLEILNIIIL